MKRDPSEARRAGLLVCALFAVTIAPASAAGGPAVPLQPSAAFHLAAADAPSTRPHESSTETHAGSPRASADAANGASPTGAPAPRASPPAASETDVATGAPAAAVPSFRSALDGYRRYQADEPLRAWRELNDEVGTVGGHAGALGAEPAEAGAGDAPGPAK